jgi:hypothetical protein
MSGQCGRRANEYILRADQICLRVVPGSQKGVLRAHRPLHGAGRDSSHILSVGLPIRITTRSIGRLPSVRSKCGTRSHLRQHPAIE